MSTIKKINVNDVLYDIEDTEARSHTSSVTSVNGKTGTVNLTASDVGAIPNTTIVPTKTSQLTNDSGFVTSSTAPVRKVNGKTGNVTLSATDVGAVPTSNNAASHNSIYRGKNLGTSITDTQWTMIKNQTYDDIYVGDYWTLNGFKWRVAALDYVIDCTNTDENWDDVDGPYVKQSIILVPDKCIAKGYVIDSDNKTLGFSNEYWHTSCKMINDDTTTVKDYLESTFPSEHRRNVAFDIASNFNTDKHAPSSTVRKNYWFFHLMQTMLFGNYVNATGQMVNAPTTSSDKEYIFNNIYVNTWFRAQLPIFALNPAYIHADNMDLISDGGLPGHYLGEVYTEFGSVSVLRHISWSITPRVTEGAGYNKNLGIRPFVILK